jgi:hypothetical protein
VRESRRVTELVEQHDGTVEAGDGPPVEQHHRRPAGARQPGAAGERHRTGDGATDHDHHRGTGRGRGRDAVLGRGNCTAPRAGHAGGTGRARRYEHAGQRVVVEHRHRDGPVVHAGHRHAVEGLLDDVEV